MSAILQLIGRQNEFVMMVTAPRPPGRSEAPSAPPENQEENQPCCKYQHYSEQRSIDEELTSSGPRPILGPVQKFFVVLRHSRDPSQTKIELYRVLCGDSNSCLG